MITAAAYLFVGVVLVMLAPVFEAFALLCMRMCRWCAPRSFERLSEEEDDEKALL